MIDTAARLRRTFPVIAIGASAGGIEPLQQFFEALPENSGCAFVVVLHLDPDRQSRLAEIVSRSTDMPVTQLTGDVTVEANNVYVIAPAQALVFEGNALRIREASDRPRHPIDTLFESLAQQRGEDAIGIILSGTGSNGSAGAAALKESGGAIFVQKPETAKHQGMPRSTIGAGLADTVLPAEELPGAVLSYLASMAQPLEPTAPDELSAVVQAVRAATGQDFRNYKASTLERRIRRRMALRRIARLGAYAEHVEENETEASALAADLLIHVTAFFRDPASWQALETNVLDPMVAKAEAGTQLRGWTAGCATGEEAYSLAMAIIERAEGARKNLEVKVFATDPSEAAIARARAGVFPGAVAETMPPERLERFFEPVGDNYVARSVLREAIVFAPQNLLADPPFSHIDIVCCRNVLIYLQAEAQAHVLSMLHFALRDDGALFLGSAETVTQRSPAFEAVVSEHRIFRRTSGGQRTARPQLRAVDLAAPASSQATTLQAAVPPARRREPDLGERARKNLADAFAPPSIVIDQRFRVRYLHGDLDPYLTHPGGEPTQDLLRLIRSGLAARLRTAAEDVWRRGEEAGFDVQLRTNDTRSPVRISVRPMSAPAEVEPDERPYLLIAFVASTSVPAGPSAERQEPEKTDVSDYEEALRLSRQELRETIQRLENSNEDLQAANEQVSSINEEFQATNEELETSKEELQSLNEELSTVNSQLQHKVDELEARTDDLNNLLTSSDVATLFLDDALRIRWFTPAMRELIRLEETDVGRSAADFAQRFKDDNLFTDMRAVLKDLSPREAEIASEEGRWFLRRVSPYRTDKNQIAGVIATFVDITVRRQAEEALRRSEQRYRALVNATASAVWDTDADGEVVQASDTWCAFTGQRDDEALGQGWLDAVHEDDRDRVAKAWSAGIAKGEVFEVEYCLRHAPDDDWRDSVSRAVPLSLPDGVRESWIVMNLDVTEVRRAHRRQQVLLDELQHRVKNLFANIKALVTLSSADAGDVASFTASLQARIDGLERTQDLLGQRSNAEVDLRTVIEGEITAHAGGSRISLVGEPILVPPRTAQALGMIVHELATNAVKYGALRDDNGSVDVSWARLGGSSPQLVFSWKESGVTLDGDVAPGFGSELIRHAAPYMMGGTADLRFERSGVRCTVEAPLEEYDPKQ